MGIAFAVRGFHSLAQVFFKREAVAPVRLCFGIVDRLVLDRSFRLFFISEICTPKKLKTGIIFNNR